MISNLTSLYFYNILFDPIQTMEQQQYQAEYYDKLLHHLNRTFAMNTKAQQLFLDMSRNTKTIRFKSIKKIYSTLTEGKADEVLYQKDKKTLIDNHVFNQKFTQRTCWRIIEKLITKVSFYLSNEHSLGGLAPSLLKVISFLRNANEKANNRASFVEFFEDVLDCIIAENNILQQKIYDLLIKRGYIYSIDEFYRLNRFQGEHTDYICPDDPDPSEAKQEQSSLGVAGKSIDTTSVVMSKGFRSRFGVLSSKRNVMHSRSRNNFEQQSIPEMQVNVEVEKEAEKSSSQEEEQDQQKAEEFNRLSHNIHQQVEKTVDQLLNNHNFSSYISIPHSEDHVSSMHDSNRKSIKPSIVRQLLKNLKNRNFKANQKILLINSTLQKGKQQQRKNSSQTLLKKKKKYKDASSSQKNRTSIAMALSKGMKQRIFKNQHLADIEDLIIHNLDKLQGRDIQSFSKEFQRVPLKKNILFRPQARPQTQILPPNNQENSAKSARRASNLQFLNNAFAFRGKILPKNSLGEMRRVSNFGPDYHMSEISSNRTIETTSYQQKQQLIEKYINKPQKKALKSPKTLRQNKKSQLSSDSQAMSRLVNQFKQLPIRQKRYFCNNHTRGKTEQFNPTLLKITAQKYNKCITEQPQAAIKTLELRELNIFSTIDALANVNSSNCLSFKKKIGSGSKMIGNYQRNRQYDVYDRKLRRML